MVRPLFVTKLHVILAEVSLLGLRGRHFRLMAASNCPTLHIERISCAELSFVARHFADPLSSRLLRCMKIRK